MSGSRDRKEKEKADWRKVADKLLYTYIMNRQGVVEGAHRHTTLSFPTICKIVCLGLALCIYVTIKFSRQAVFIYWCQTCPARPWRGPEVTSEG